MAVLYIPTTYNCNETNDKTVYVEYLSVCKHNIIIICYLSVHYRVLRFRSIPVANIITMIYARRGGCNYKDIRLQNIVGGRSLWRNIFLRGFSCFKLHYRSNITISCYNEHVDISTILLYYNAQPRRGRQDYCSLQFLSFMEIVKSLGQTLRITIKNKI